MKNTLLIISFLILFITNSFAQESNTASEIVVEKAKEVVKVEETVKAEGLAKVEEVVKAEGIKNKSDEILEASADKIKKEKGGESNAYGKNKGELNGKEYGKERAQQAKSKKKEKKVKKAKKEKKGKKDKKIKSTES